MAELEIQTKVRSWKYTITQTSRGARVTVHGDALGKIVADYATLRQHLESGGFNVAPDEYFPLNFLCIIGGRFSEDVRYDCN